MGGHLATGINLMFSDNFGITSRLGYRLIKMDETHIDPLSSTGYSSFYVDLQNGQTVKVDWSGTYLTIGLIISFKKKQ